VEAALQRYSEAIRRMDDEAISESFVPEGEMGSAGQPPIKGRGRIARHVRKMKDYRIKSNVVTSESVTFSGDEALQKATFQQVATTPGGKTIEAKGRLEAVWVLESDGVWRLRKLTAFPDKPAEAAKPKR
ncbi:MAG TPA: SgcJ/EcaC family oxidoreductase, partial [Thermoanaerobaculia bacterium]|nr:SgcJ/EcaC family oxidoreductase [Thermoanaerobaculia bacterium]